MTATFENCLVVSYELYIHLLYGPAVSLLSIYPREMKTTVYTKDYIQTFIAALYIITKT